MTGSVRSAAGGPETAADRMEAAWPAVSANVGEARALVRDFGHRHGASPAVLDDIALAVSEAASNVVLHAFASA
jgi:anti-sigma regulatory factor (Ser/Thr protein kinase)